MSDAALLDLYVRVLTDPQLLAWDAWDVPGGLHPPDPLLMLRRAAQALGLSDHAVPVEQVDLVQDRARRWGGEYGGLLAVGQALEFLARRSFEFRDGYPRPRTDGLLDLQEVRTRVVEDHLTCFCIALHLRDRRQMAPPASGLRLQLDWTAGTIDDVPFIERRLQRGLVDAHVHLGGVLGTVDLWQDVLDPRSAPQVVRRLRGWQTRLGAPLVGPLFLRRLLDARVLRDVLALHLSLIGALPPSPFPSLACGLERGAAPAGPADAPEGGAAERFLKQARAEAQLLGSGPDVSPALAATLAARAPVPLLLSPWWRSHNQSETGSVRDVVIRERELLVAAFGAVLGVFPTQPEPWFGRLLGVYLVCQNLFHRAVTQSGKRVGFANFLDWYDSPLRDLRPSIEARRQQRVLRRVTLDGRVRVEGRVRPRPAVVRGWVRAFERRAFGPGLRLGQDFGLVGHFIKQRDRSPSVPALPSAPWRYLRFGRLRRDLRFEALELERLRTTDPRAAWALLAIDAAREERDTPPEVFAPAFRFLRRGVLAAPDGASALDFRDGTIPPLRATFHVGESFHHPVSGLRAVDEALHFLDLGPRDRIGHGLVLGCEPQAWLARCGPAPHLPREELLDDLVWMAYVLRAKAGERVVPAPLEDAIAVLAGELYEGIDWRGPWRIENVLHAAWSLRWMDPGGLDGFLGRLGWRHGHPPRKEDDAAPPLGRSTSNFSPCGQRAACRLCLAFDEVRRSPLSQGGTPRAAQTARRCDALDARDWARCAALVEPGLSAAGVAWRLATLDLNRLYDSRVPELALECLLHYHFDVRYRYRARESVPWPRELSIWESEFERLRAYVLDGMRARAVVVEACPSSNSLIGAFDGLTQHPLWRLTSGESPVRVSVNTDNPGIAGTTLPNEYVLLAAAHAARRGGAPTDRQTIDAVERLRVDSEDATFLRSSGATGPPPAARAADDGLPDGWHRWFHTDDRADEERRILDGLRRGLHR